MLVASDRISIYDVVLPTPIPDKGAVLTQLSLWWFDRLADLVPQPRALGHRRARRSSPGGRCAAAGSTCCRSSASPAATSPGCGLKEYEKTGTVSGVALPPGLVEGSRLPEPIFTPTTKAPLGEHDEFITFAEVEALVGAATAERLRDLTLDVYARGAELAADDTGSSSPTPSSSSAATRDGRDRAGRRGADARTRRGSGPPTAGRPGGPQFSFDKQFVRDWSARRSTGTAPRPARRSRRTSSPPPAPVTSRSTSASPGFISPWRNSGVLYVSLSGGVVQEAFVAALDARGVPLTHLLRPADAPAELVAVDPRARRRSRPARLRPRHPAPRPRPRRKGEFASLPHHEAALRLTAARRALTAVGLWTDVFVPPRWLASDGTVAAAVEQGFRVLAVESGIHDLHSGAVVPARVLGARSAPLGVAWVLRRGGPVRIHVRAKDLRRPGRTDSVLAAIDTALGHVTRRRTGGPPVGWPDPHRQRLVGGRLPR